ncbi:MAG: SurA N-terminal domain-containing protein [Flavobacteriaceae bacterium]|nr:SurA N-terminal domain-containing protein [Flavobacteriaceae bacterium]
MAILSKIRERSVFLILIIGLALLAFVLDPSSIQSFFQGNKVNVVGEVNGETISREDFANLVEGYKANSRNPSNQQAQNDAWNKLVGDKIYDDQLEKAGIVVGEEDVWQAIIAIPFFKTNPAFQNEAGLFDQEKVKEYVANLKDDAIGSIPGSQEYNVWQSWLETEADLRQNLKKSTYEGLVTAGLSATLKEGERAYTFDNNKVTSKYVYVPYSSISDSLITIANSEYVAYIDKHASEFQVEESRDINYVSFNVVASEEDRVAIKQEVANYIEDREEYSNAAKTNITVQGLRNATEASVFLEEAKSDLPNDSRFLFKNYIATEIADEIFNANLGDIVGPYEDRGFFKVSKVNAVKQMPDSVKSRHILISFEGATRSATTVTKEAAKKTADSIYNLVRRSSSKFIEIADEVNTDGTKGKGGDIGWISSAQAFSPNFDVDFANYLFDNKKGAVGVVETKFGFHIIKIDDQTTYKKAVQLITLAREITPSVETENKFYLEAEIFASDVDSGADVFELTKAKDYKLAPAIGLKILDENVPGLIGNQRQIVNWAFNVENDLGTVKRFDVDNGYVVAVLSGKTPKGSAPVSKVQARIRPILMNEKKAELIKEKMKGSSLDEIAKNAGTNVKVASKVSLASPTLSGVGSEPAVVGAMSSAAVGVLHKNIAGVKGVFSIEVSSIEAAPELPNYGVARAKVYNALRGRSAQIGEALKDAYEIEDYRGSMY